MMIVWQLIYKIIKKTRSQSISVVNALANALNLSQKDKEEREKRIALREQTGKRKLTQKTLLDL